MSNKPARRNGGLSRSRKAGLVGLATVMAAGPFASIGGIASPVSALPGPVSVSLFYDSNFNGVRDAAETFGPGGVTVRAYDQGNALAGSAVTDENGNATFTPAGSGPWRVEVDPSTLRAGLAPGRQGGVFSFTFFADGGGAVTNVAVWEPQRYVDPAAGDPSYAVNAQSAAGAIWNSAEIYPAAASGAAAPTAAPASIAQTGSVFGIAYSPSSAAVYQSAFHKRFSPYGAGGPGAIYRNGALFATIPNSGMTDNTFAANPGYVAATGHGTDYQDPSVTGGGEDFAGQVNVGKSGLGGMDMLTDVASGTETLYVVNMSDKSMYPVNASTGAVGAPVPIPNPVGANWRPMGLKVHNGLIYVGGVDAATTQGYVYAYDVAAGTWSGAPVWSQAVNFPRSDSSTVANAWVDQNDNAVRDAGESAPIDVTFRPWTDDLTGSYCGALVTNPAAAGTVDDPFLCHLPQPMLSDIDFDRNGNMLLSFRDRFGDQISANFGFPATLPEGNALVDTTSGGAVARRQGVGLPHSMLAMAPRISNVQFGAISQPYDENVSTGVFEGHEQSTGGAALALPSGNAVVTFSDPLVPWPADDSGSNAVGTRLFGPATPASSDVQPLSGLMVYGAAVNAPAGKQNLGGFGKGGGLGDLVALTSPAPIEIGNRVWLDANGNGIQDPKLDLNGDGDFTDPGEDATSPEPGIPGVTIELLDAAGTVVQTTVTGADGNYLFSGLAPNTTYTIRIPDGQTQTTGIPVLGATAFGSLPITTPNVDGLIDQGDSDFVGTGDYTATVTTGFSGANNHTYDAGFLAAVDLSLEKYVDPDGSGFVDADSTADAPFISADAPFTYRITVANASSVPATGVAVTDVLPAGVTFVSATAGGTAAGQTVTWAGLTVPGGGSIDLDVTVVVNAADAGVFAAGARALNSAQITASDLPDIDSTPGNDTDPATPQNEDDDDPAFVQMAADVSLVKLVDPNATDGNAAGDFVEANSAPGPVIRAAQNFTYRIVATNDGPSAARNVVVRDVLPADVEFVSATMGGVNTAGTVDWTINLAAGETVNLDVTVVVPHANVAAFLGNQTRLNPAQVFSNPIPDPDSTPGNDTDPATPQNEDDDDPATVFLPIADLEVVKRINAIDNGLVDHGGEVRSEEQFESTTPLTVDVGAEITWQIQVTNVGPDAATGVIVSDVLPASTQYVTSSSLNGAYDPATGLWTLANPVPAGGQATLSIRAILLPSTIGEQTADLAPVVNVTAVQAVNEADPDSIPGDPVVTNQDDNDDAVLNPQAAAIGDVVWHDLDGDGVQDAGEPGIPGVQVTLRIDAPILTSTGAELIPAGTSWVTSTNPDGTYVFENLPANVEGIPYTVTVASPGTDWIPTGQDQGADDATDSDADPETGEMAQTTLTIGERDMTWDAGFYLPAELALVKTVTGLSGVAHDAVPHGADAPAADGDPCNLTPPAGGSADGGCDLVDVGVPFSYTITVSNSGPGVARDVVVNEVFPSAMTVRSVTAVVGDTELTLDPAAASWTLPDLGVDETAEITVTAVVSAAQASSYLAADGRTVFGLENRASVTTSTPDDPSIPETDSPNVDVASHQPVLFVLPSIIKEVNTGGGWFDANTLPAAQTFRFGQDFQYRITVRNAGNITATGMTVTDVLPANVAFVASDPSQGTFDQATGVWTIGPVAADGSATLAMTVKVATADRAAFSVGDSRLNTAVLSPADQPLDPRKPAPDYDDPAVITPPAAVGNLVWDDWDRDGIQDIGEPGVPGIVVNVVKGGVVVATTTTDSNGMWTIDNLDPGSDYVVNYELPDAWQQSPVDQGSSDLADSDGVAPTVAPLESGEVDPSYDLGVWRAVDLAVTKAGKRPSINSDQVIWTITVTNNGPGVAVQGFKLTDALEAQQTFIFAEGADWICDTPAVGTNGTADCTSVRTLMPGESTELRITTGLSSELQDRFNRTPAGNVATLFNQAQVSIFGGQFESVLDNNSYDSQIPLTKSEIPRTGGDSGPLLIFAAGLGVSGLLLAGGVRRRLRKQT